MSTSGRGTRLLLGVAQLLVGIVLLPVSLFLGVASMLVAPAWLLWMAALGLRLQRPTATVRKHLRATHMVVLPIAVFCVLYGAYALSAAAQSAESGGGLLGAFGVVPIVSGLVAGSLSSVSLWLSGSLHEDVGVESK